MTVVELISGNNTKKPDEQVAISPQTPLETDASVFRVYKRRWFVLLISLSSDILMAFRSWRFPIINIVYPFWGTNIEQVLAWSLLPLLINAIMLIPSGRALDKWGLRKMAYITGPIMILSNVLQSIIMFDEADSIIWIAKEYRFGTFVFCNCLLMLAYANFSGLSAKISNDWFPIEETTFAIALPMIAAKLIEASISFLSPKFVLSYKDLRYVAYINLALIILYGLVLLTCLKRSHPEIPPSKNALIARQNKLPSLSSYLTILEMPSFMIAMFAFGINAMSSIILKGVFTQALTSNGYTNEFAGILLSIGSVTSVLGFLASPWFDRNFDYIRISRYLSILVAISFTIHYLSQLWRDLEYVILSSCVILYILMGILSPLQMQAMLRPSKGLIPDASIASLNCFISVICYAILSIILIGTKSSGYLVPYTSFSSIVIVINLSYAAIFRSPEIQI